MWYVANFFGNMARKVLKALQIVPRKTFFFLIYPDSLNTGPSGMFTDMNICIYATGHYILSWKFVKKMTVCHENVILELIWDQFFLSLLGLEWSGCWFVQQSSRTFRTKRQLFPTIATCIFVIHFCYDLPRSNKTKLFQYQFKGHSSSSSFPFCEFIS